jgi:hypothetical protein
LSFIPAEAYHIHGNNQLSPQIFFLGCCRKNSPTANQAIELKVLTATPSACTHNRHCRYAPASSEGLPSMYNPPPILQFSTNISSSSMCDPSEPDTSFFLHYNLERHVPHKRSGHHMRSLKVKGTMNRSIRLLPLFIYLHLKRRPFIYGAHDCF